MKKIFYSEKLNKNFDTEEACIEAENQYDKEKAAESEKKALVSKKKKELSDNVVAADKKVDEAYTKYEAARERAAGIIQKANKEAEDILREAAKEVEKATEHRMNQIKVFNDEFGPYMTSYVGEKAVEEYNKVVKRMREILYNNGLFWML